MKGDEQLLSEQRLAPVMTHSVEERLRLNHPADVVLVIVLVPLFMGYTYDLYAGDATFMVTPHLSVKNYTEACAKPFARSTFKKYSLFV